MPVGPPATSTAQLYVTTNCTALITDLHSPIFSPALTPITVTVGAPYTLVLTTFDGNPGDIVTKALVGSYSFPITLSGGNLLISPSLPAHIGTYTVTLSLSDGLFLPKFTFTLTVISGNTAPTFLPVPLPPLSVHQGQTISVALPSVIDPDAGDLAAIIVTVLKVVGLTVPPYVTITGTVTSGLTLVIAPSLIEAAGVYSIEVGLKDPVNPVVYFPFSLTIITNRAP